MDTGGQITGDGRECGIEGSGTTQLNLPGKPFALYKSLELLGYFDSPGEAFAAGIAQFPDGTFSIQNIARAGLPPELRSLS